MIVYINSILFPIKNLGPGNRVGIWFQGCTIKCKGCISVHTWNKDSKYKTTTTQVIKQILSYDCNKLTISGGEPFEQAKELKVILEGIRKKIDDIIIYSGMKKEIILKNYPWIKNLCDLLISEPYIEKMKTDKIWKGSDNQIATIFRNQKLYKKWLESKKDKRLQLINNTIVGIP